MSDEPSLNLRKTLNFEQEFESNSIIFELSKPTQDKKGIVAEINESSDNDEETQRQPSLSVLLSSEDSFKVDERFLVEFTKENTKFVNREVRESCKVLSFSSDLNVDEILSIIDGLNSTEYPNLFIFIIHAENIQFSRINKRKKVRKNKTVNNIKEIVLKFSKSRPLILQLTSENENATKFYYKSKNSPQFSTIDQHQKSFDKSRNFPTFLCSFFNRKFQNFDDQISKYLTDVQELSLILKFLRIFTLNEEFWIRIIFELSKNGSKDQLLAAIDASFEDNDRNLNIEAENYFTTVFIEPQASSQLSLELDQIQQEFQLDSPLKNLSPQVSTDEQFIDNPLETSILHTAVENINKEVVDFAISHYTHLIQQLPFRQQLKISTAAFLTNQFDVLCDLLDICDFPFPENYNFDDGSIVHDKLRKITKDRIELGRMITLENFEKIDEFFERNSNIRIVYNPLNDSAMYHAVKNKKFQAYFYLKSLGFRATEFGDLQDILNDEELKEANQYAGEQRRKNVTDALSDDQKSVNLLYIKSFIHNKKISKEQEVGYRKKIRKWYEDIYKVKFGAELLNVVASCEHLKVIFDFESCTVENVSLSGPNSLGSTYPNRKWIFVGSKLFDKRREQQIKGILAHELCHYFMRLVYENQENPYYKHMTNKKEIFEEIVKIIDQWSSIDEINQPDDECNGTISSVFQLYDRDEFHLELIVRVVQILVEYDDDEVKLKHLMDKYKMLFVFWEFHIIPELKSFDLTGREDVRRINRIFDILPKVKDEKLEFSVPKDIKATVNSKVVKVTSNVPQLLLVNIKSYLQVQFGNLYDTQNIFIDPQKLNNQEMLNNLVQIMSEHPKLRIIVDCSKGFLENIKKILAIKESSLVFVISSVTQKEELVHILKSSQKNPVKLEVNYKWCDLTEESKETLLETKVNFQNNSQFSLNDLLKIDKKRHDSISSNDITKYFADIIDCLLLNQLVDKSEIVINSVPKSSENDGNFDFLFQSRQFIDKFSVKILQDELLQEVKNKKYVLISDIAGNGKSWMMKNFATVLRKQNSKNWVTYVDLKQYIDDFRTQKSKPTFLNFFLEKIFKPKNKFESKIFSKLYKSGKAFILFDGFDEIAPNCAEFVLQLAESFDSNGGNQMWIATRDYFKIDILNKLKLDAVYKLDEFTKENGINLVVSSWILMDLKGKRDFKSREEFEKYSKSLPSYKTYEHKARLIVQKVAMSEYRSVGLPQLFKMIAEGFKDDKDTKLDLKGSKIYAKFAQNLYKRWSDEKGTLRKEASIKSQEYEVNFWKFHQYFAFARLFHEFLKALFPNYDGSEWSDAEIIACGLMSKRGEAFYFLHETFREFFISDFIAKALKKLKIDESTKSSIIARFFRKKELEDYLIELVVIILTTKEYGTILMFLDDAIDDYSNLKKIQCWVQKSIKKFYEMENFCEFFTKNLKNLTIFLIAILKTGDYAEVKRMVTENAIKIVENTEDSKSFFIFQEFLFEFLKVDDLKYLIMDEGIIHAIFVSNLEIEAFKDFVIKAERITDDEFIKNALKLNKTKWMDGNIFHLLGCSLKIDGHKVQIFLKIMQKFFKMPEIFELIKNCDDQHQNIFKDCIQTNNTENLKVLWTEIQNFFTFHKLPQYFKEVVQQKSSTACNILHWMAKCVQIEFHETIWDLLLKTFEDREELKNLIVQRNKIGDNSFHELVQNNKNPEIIEFTLEIYKITFNDAQLQEILKSVGRLELNLLQSAAYESNVVNQHRFLWKIFQNSYQSDQEFLKMLKEVDMFGRNILNIAAANSSNEVFEFLIKELEKIAPLHTIRKMISNLDSSRRNILQSAVMHNKFSKLHEYLWKILRKYFGESEILGFIKHLDKDGDDLIFIAVGNNRRKIVELTWKEIKNFMDLDEQVEYLKMRGYKCKNLLEKSLDNWKYKKEAHEWVQSLMHDYLQYFKEIVQQSVSDISGILHWTAECDKIEFHTTLWEVLFKKVKNREDLKNCVIQKNILGDTFIHKLIQNKKNSEIIKATFETFQENFNVVQIQGILEAKGRWGMTLLQTAAFESNVAGFHQLLWKIFQNSYKSREEFLKIIMEVDMLDRNILNISAAHSTSGVCEFFIRELQKIAPNDMIREMLMNLDDNNRNILQSAAMCNISLELHKTLWRVLRQYFELSEIIKFIKHTDKYGNNILFIAVRHNKKKVAELTWKEIKCFLNKTEQVNYLKIKGWKGKNLFDSSLDNWKYEREIHEWVQSLMFSVMCQKTTFKEDEESIEDDEESYY